MGSFTAAELLRDCGVVAGGPMEVDPIREPNKGLLWATGMLLSVESREPYPDEGAGQLVTDLERCCRKLITGYAGGADTSEGWGGTIRLQSVGIMARVCLTIGAILQNPADWSREGHTHSSAIKHHTKAQNVIIMV